MSHFQESKKKERRLIIFILVGALFIILVGAVGMQIGKYQWRTTDIELVLWERCVNENTTTSYAKYLVQYPDGRYSQQALSIIDSLETIK